MNPSLFRRACPACGSSKSEIEIVSRDFMLEGNEDFFVSRCGACGLLFQNPALRPEFLGRHYPDDYGPYTAEEMRPGKSALRHLKVHQGYEHLEAPPVDPLRKLWGRRAAGARLLPDFVPGGKLLEIACASGARLALLRKLGWTNCRGIELGEAAAQRAREKGFPVITGRVEEALGEIPDASLDAVIASAVLEHLENPFRIVEQIAAKLKPGGQFLFSTIHVDAPDFHLYRKFWYNLDLPRHSVFFRKKDLASLTARDFQVESIHYQIAANDYVGSARYRSRQEKRRIDSLLLKLGSRIFPALLLLAALGHTSRVSVRCRKTGAV